jgi:hypothetical protein
MSSLSYHNITEELTKISNKRYSTCNILLKLILLKKTLNPSAFIAALLNVVNSNTYERKGKERFDY